MSSSCAGIVVPSLHTYVGVLEPFLQQLEAVQLATFTVESQVRCRRGGEVEGRGCTWIVRAYLWSQARPLYIVSWYSMWYWVWCFYSLVLLVVSANHLVLVHNYCVHCCICSISDLCTPILMSVNSELWPHNWFRGCTVCPLYAYVGGGGRDT